MALCMAPVVWLVYLLICSVPLLHCQEWVSMGEKPFQAVLGVRRR